MMGVGKCNSQTILLYKLPDKLDQGCLYSLFFMSCGSNLFSSIWDSDVTLSVAYLCVLKRLYFYLNLELSFILLSLEKH